MHAEKVEFLKYRFLAVLRKIPSDRPPAWGRMTLQQMIEHFSDTIRIASGKTPVKEIITQPQQLEKMRAFAISDKPFRENTVNPLLPQTPAPVRNISINEALKELDREITYFFSVFEKNRWQVTRNPFFGDLNFEENVHLLHKHALHHLRQFDVSDL